MHRSGTSLVSGMLSCMGVYMDPAWPAMTERESVVPPGPLVRRNGYGEATAFRLFNEKLLHWAGAEWDDPNNFLRERDKEPFDSRCLRAIRSATYGELRGGYLNLAPSRIEAWGWKDPRNSLTLPYWLRAFPEARVLHVRRDPDRIVDSLLKREQATRLVDSATTVGSRVRRLASDPRLLAAAVIRRLRPSKEPRVPRPALDRDRCYELAEAYVSECLRYRTLGRQYEEIHYEDILRAPRTLAAYIAEFARAAPSEDRISVAASFVIQPEAVPALERATSGGKALS